MALGKVNINMNTGAAFNDERTHRYALWRIWDESKPLVQFIGLNPSRATEHKNDNTIHKILKIAYYNDYGGFYMTNLFSFITPYPEQLETPEANIIDNDEWLYNIRKTCKNVVFAWGNFKIAKWRAEMIIERFPGAMVIKQNKNGSPVHPLYQKGTSKLIKFVP